MTFGEYVHELRTTRRLTTAELAEASGLAVPTIAAIEDGHEPTLSILRKLARGLDMLPSTLLAGYEAATCE